ncbi:hypothetical protein BDZ88DRAFT_210598 [Geranomyces variabilis]|nr:hypothetical protein BDZ88DRAFT_210598 [Geranomyces variabilis]
MSTTSERLSAVTEAKARGRRRSSILQMRTGGASARKDVPIPRGHFVNCRAKLIPLHRQDKEIDRLRRLLKEKEEDLVVAVTMIEEYQNERAAPAATDPLDASTLATGSAYDSVTAVPPPFGSLTATPAFGSSAIATPFGLPAASAATPLGQSSTSAASPFGLPTSSGT